MKINVPIPPVGEAGEEEKVDEESKAVANIKEVEENLISEQGKNQALKEELLGEYEKIVRLTDDNLNLKNINEDLVDRIKKLESEIEKMNKIKEINSTLEEDLKNFYVDKENLQNRISELSLDLENMSKMKSVPQISVANSKILNNIDKELLKYKEFEKKIFAAEDLLKSKLIPSEDPAGLREILISTLLHEKNSINDSIFEAFLEDYYREIDRLEIQASTYVLKYNDAMKLLTIDQKELKTELEKQNRQVDSLNFLYNKLLNEKIRFKVDQYLNKKKINEMIEIDKEKTQIIQSLNEKLENLASELSNKAMEVIENMDNEVSEIGSYSNIRRPIKGGQKFLTKLAMSDNKSIKFFSDLIKAHSGS